MAEQIDRKEEQLVVFTLAGESYAVDIAMVHEIVRMQHITRIPRSPEFLEGVTNLRGQVIPVVDLRKRLRLPISEHTSGTRIIVVEFGEQTIGMIVDGVSEVLRVTTDAIEPPSPIITTVDCDSLRGIVKLDNRLVILLSFDKVLTVEERGMASEASNAAMEPDEAA